MLVSWSLAGSYLPDVYAEWTRTQYWLVGTLTSLLVFASVLAHEVSHSLVARGRSMPVRSITLFVFGGVSELGGEPRSARDEFWMAIVGPLTSFAAALLFAAIWLAARAVGATPLRAMAGYLAYINVAVGIFNLLPGLPLDGGRVLRSAVWRVKRNMLEATRIASNAGRVIAALLIGIGLLALVGGELIGGLWFMLIGWFLWNAAESSYQQLLIETSLHGMTVASLVEPETPRIDPDASLQDLARDGILRQNRRAFFVVSDAGDIEGLVTLTDLRKTPEGDWEAVPVRRAMTPVDRLVTITPQAEVVAALQLMVDHDVNQLPVMSGGMAVGLLTRAGLLRAIQQRLEIGALRGGR